MFNLYFPPQATLTAQEIQYEAADAYSYSGTTESRQRSPVMKREPRIGTSTTVSALVLSSPHPWYIENLQRLESFRDMGCDWHETDAAVPSGKAIDASKKVLDWLSNVNFKPNRIDPSSAGGVCFSFTNGERYADIECLNSGTIVALTMDGDNNPDVWDFQPSNLPRAVATINGFVGR